VEHLRLTKGSCRNTFKNKNWPTLFTRETRATGCPGASARGSSGYPLAGGRLAWTLVRLDLLVMDNPG
jgi:hypothetical protein